MEKALAKSMEHSAVRLVKRGSRRCVFLCIACPHIFLTLSPGYDLLAMMIRYSALNADVWSGVDYVPFTCALVFTMGP